MPHYRPAALPEEADAADPAGRDRMAAALRSPHEGCSQPTEQTMDQRVVETPQRASQGQKPAVTRYVLTIGLTLVVILFAVAYVISV
jgi:hypothetical protein